jgi:two-component system cell cycle sensor histidine kinase/response regulator CckA
MLKQLTAVAPRDNDALTLKRGHALAWTMLLFMVIGLALGGIALIDLDVPALINTAVGMVVFILVYAINRGGRVQLAATILIIAGGCITVSGAIVAQRPIPTLFFLGIIVVVAAAFGRPIAPLGWAAALSLTPFIINAAVYGSLLASTVPIVTPDGLIQPSIFSQELEALALLWMLAGTAYISSGLLNQLLDESRAATAQALAVNQELRRSEERFAKVFQRNPVGISITGLDDGQVIDINDSLLSLLGYSRDEVIGKTTLELNIWEQKNNRERTVQMLREGQSIHDQKLRIRTKLGELREGLNAVELIELDGETCMLSMLYDITERQRIEAALRDSEEQYRLIAEHSRDLIALLDHEGRLLYASPSHQPVLGYAPIELIGRIAIGFIHPDDHVLILSEWAKLATTGHLQITLRVRHTNGEWLWIETSSSIFDQQGSTVNVSRDVTERKRLEAQLLQSQKMEMIGRLAGGIAHDFNNLLTAITGYADLALEDLPPASPARGDLEELRKATDRATSLTSQLLAFARKQRIELRVVNLNQLIGDMGGFIRRLIGEHIELVTRPAPDLGSVRVDTSQIEQVVVNLVINARDAMPEGGRLVIETSNVVLDAEYAGEHFDVAAGRYILLTVRDTGVGMDAAVQEHLFEPFFTTKGLGKGTGLGLATCYGIVKQHSGYILSYSELGRGTLMKVYLPRVDAPLEPLPATVVRPNPRGHETILLVEDEPAVRDLAARVLRSQGYAVLEAGNGVEALILVEQEQSTRIDLLLTDVVMPRMGGAALAERLSALRPGIKVLFTSGYTEDSMLHDGQLAAGTYFLHKPFSPSALAQKVRSIFDP